MTIPRDFPYPKSLMIVILYIHEIVRLIDIKYSQSIAVFQIYCQHI